MDKIFFFLRFHIDFGIAGEIVVTNRTKAKSGSVCCTSGELLEYATRSNLEKVGSLGSFRKGGR